MEQAKLSTKIAGIDVAKKTLDVAVYGVEALIQVGNDPAGFIELAGWFEGLGVRRVGLEATGGYERALVAFLQKRGFEVVVHQPLEVRLFARLKRHRAKNDRIDARLIAAATAQVDRVKAAADPLVTELAEWMTAYEQASDQVAQLKTYLEQVTSPQLEAHYQAQLLHALGWKADMLRAVLGRIKSRPDLARRYALLLSLPGAGPVVAASLVIRMPELGSMQPGQAAALIGVAPYDFDTGQYKGQRHISGGRARPRRMLYLAALAAKRCDPGLRAFAERLLAAGKPPKVVITAVMRKLIQAANLVLARGEPWIRTLTA